MLYYTRGVVSVKEKLQILKDKQDDIFDRTAQILSALAAPVRINLIHFLSQAPLTVDVLAHKIDQSVANTSMHLRKLLNENIVSVETVGQKRLYSLHEAMQEFWEHSQDFIQKIDPSLKLTGSEVYEEMNWKKEVSLEKDKNLIFLDVRPLDEASSDALNLEKRNNYLHIPVSELKDKLNLIPKNKKIIVVCRGRMCALSAYAVNYLRKHNFKAFRLDKSWFALKNK